MSRWWWYWAGLGDVLGGLRWMRDSVLVWEGLRWGVLYGRVINLGVVIWGVVVGYTLMNVVVVVVVCMYGLL